MKLHLLLAAGCLSAALTSCAQPQPAPSASAPELESQRLARELRSLIGPAACTAHTQCAALPVGVKACGGPAGYWAWSPQAANADRIQAVAQRLADAQRRDNEASGLRSNCAITPPPSAVCTAGRCELQTAPASAL